MCNKFLYSKLPHIQRAPPSPHLCVTQILRLFATQLRCEVLQTNGDSGFLEFYDLHANFASANNSERDRDVGLVVRDGEQRAGQRWLVLVKGSCEKEWKTDFTITAQQIACFRDFCAAEARGGTGGAGAVGRRTCMVFVSACLQDSTICISHFLFDVLEVLQGRAVPVPFSVQESSSADRGDGEVDPFQDHEGSDHLGSLRHDDQEDRQTLLVLFSSRPPTLLHVRSLM
jgi:hypothetical protein